MLHKCSLDIGQILREDSAVSFLISLCMISIGVLQGKTDYQRTNDIMELDGVIWN
jgi:hypothetical protein